MILKTSVETAGQAERFILQGLWRFAVNCGAVGVKWLKPLHCKAYSEYHVVN